MVPENEKTKVSGFHQEVRELVLWDIIQEQWLVSYDRKNAKPWFDFI